MRPGIRCLARSKKAACPLKRCRTRSDVEQICRKLCCNECYGSSSRKQRHYSLGGYHRAYMFFCSEANLFYSLGKLRCDFTPRKLLHSQPKRKYKTGSFLRVPARRSPLETIVVFLQISRTARQPNSEPNSTLKLMLKLQRRCPRRTVSRHTHSNISVSTAATRTSSSCNARWHGGAMYTHIDRWTTPYSQTLLASTCAHTPHMFGQISRMYPKRQSQGKNPARRAHREMV